MRTHGATLPDALQVFNSTLQQISGLISPTPCRCVLRGHRRMPPRRDAMSGFPCTPWSAGIMASAVSRQSDRFKNEKNYCRREAQAETSRETHPILGGRPWLSVDAVPQSFPLAAWPVTRRHFPGPAPRCLPALARVLKRPPPPCTSGWKVRVQPRGVWQGSLHYESVERCDGPRHG